MIMHYLPRMQRLFPFMLDMGPQMVSHMLSQLISDNVPVWHSRRLAECVNRKGGNVTYDFFRCRANERIDEVPDGGHWFDRIMTQGEVGDFLRKMSAANPFIRPVTKRFVIANPREMGQRGGIKVEQLVSWQRFFLSLDYLKEGLARLRCNENL